MSGFLQDEPEGGQEDSQGSDFSLFFMTAHPMLSADHLSLSTP